MAEKDEEKVPKSGPKTPPEWDRMASESGSKKTSAEGAGKVWILVEKGPLLGGVLEPQEGTVSGPLCLVEKVPGCHVGRRQGRGPLVGYQSISFTYFVLKGSDTASRRVRRRIEHASVTPAPHTLVLGLHWMEFGN